MLRQKIKQLPEAVRQYLLITFNYWAFTLTDGALRMLVVLHFYDLGYSPLQIALLFLFYEVFGVITNLLGGWLGARIGLNKTMNLGLAMQVIALLMLVVPEQYLTVLWVMMAQALSGIAKDLNKMSAKSAIKTLIPKEAEGALYHWVAVLTGSKNTLKGVGFFLGGGLLMWLGFRGALLAMASTLALIWILSVIFLKKDIGKAQKKPKFRQLFSKCPAINFLSAARMFLFGSRDLWFVVALPVYLSEQFHWDHWQVGGFLALWIVGYGLVQAAAPKIISLKDKPFESNHNRDKQTLIIWSSLLFFIPAFMSIALMMKFNAEWVLIIGLMIYGFVFAINSAYHSYVIVSFATDDGVSMDVGFYYMANAMGRLIGTVLSGWVFQQFGLIACLGLSAVFIALTVFFSGLIPASSDTSNIHPA